MLLSLRVASLHGDLLLYSRAPAPADLHLTTHWAEDAEVGRLVDAADWRHVQTLPVQEVRREQCLLLLVRRHLVLKGAEAPL